MSSLGMTFYADGRVIPNQSRSPAMNRSESKGSRYKPTNDGRYSKGLSQRPDVRTTRDHLARQAEAVARYLWPDGKVVSGEWRIGNVQGDSGQSLGVILTGPKAGQWKDFATGEGGDLLDAWETVYGVSLPQATKEATDWLGLLADDPPIPKAKTGKPVRVQPNPPVGDLGTDLFEYTDGAGKATIYVKRRGTGKGKQFAQWGRTAEGDGRQMNLDNAPSPRPLFMLSEVIGSDLPIVFHEGEKAAVAAYKGKLFGCHTARPRRGF